MTNKRSVAEKYTIYNEKGRYLATIFLDNQVGEISVQSEYGNYAYGWYKESRGTDTLKEFLVDTYKNYVRTKFGYDGKNDYFYVDKTISNIKKEILRLRKDKEIDKEQALDCWQEIKHMDSHHKTCQELYGQLDQWAPTTMELIYGNSPYDVPWVTGTHPQLVAFMDKVWPLFIAEIREELKGTVAQYG